MTILLPDDNVHPRELLWKTIADRRDADPKTSYSSYLLSCGMPKMAQKLGEEAVELVIEAIQGNRVQIIKESADVVYHLLALWVAADIVPQLIWDELTKRQGISGIAEKNTRSAR